MTKIRTDNGLIDFDEDVNLGDSIDDELPYVNKGKYFCNCKECVEKRGEILPGFNVLGICGLKVLNKKGR